MSNTTANSTEVTVNQWDSIPDEVKQVYLASTERLYATGIGGEDIRQKEANIYNSIFGQYGLTKTVRN